MTHNQKSKLKHLIRECNPKMKIMEKLYFKSFRIEVGLFCESQGHISKKENELSLNLNWTQTNESEHRLCAWVLDYETCNMRVNSQSLWSLIGFEHVVLATKEFNELFGVCETTFS